jgi:hypothetical protein
VTVSATNPEWTGSLHAAEASLPSDREPTVGLRDVTAPSASLLGMAKRALAASERHPGETRGQDDKVSAAATHGPNYMAGGRKLCRARGGAVRARRHARLVLEHQHSIAPVAAVLVATLLVALVLRQRWAWWVLVTFEPAVLVSFAVDFTTLPALLLNVVGFALLLSPQMRRHVRPR